MEVLSISLRNPSSVKEPVNKLRIEQEEWGVNVGRITKDSALQFMYYILFNANTPYTECGVEGSGLIKCNILVYPDDSTMPYSLHSSYGDLQFSKAEEFEEKEDIIFTSSSSSTIKYNVSSVLDYKWEGDVFDIYGKKILSRVVPTIEDGKVILDRPVSGNLILTYEVHRDVWVLSVYPRSSLYAPYDSLVYGRYTNGISWEKIEAPPNSEKVVSGKDCTGLLFNYTGFGGSTTITPIEDSPDSAANSYTPPSNKESVDRKTIVDFCSQLVLSDTI